MNLQHPSLLEAASLGLPGRGSHSFLARAESIIPKKDDYQLTAFRPKEINLAGFHRRVTVIDPRNERSAIEDEGWSVCGIFCCCPCFIISYLLEGSQRRAEAANTREAWENLKKSEVLKQLDFQQSPLKNMTPIIGFSKLTQLNIAHSELSSLQGIETLHYLEEINVSYVRGKLGSSTSAELHEPKWSALSQLYHLRKIIAVSTEVFRYLSSLASLRHLEEVDLSDCVYYTLSSYTWFERETPNRYGGGGTFICKEFNRKQSDGVVDLDHFRAFPALNVVILNGSDITDTQPNLPLIGLELRGGDLVNVEALEDMQQEIAASNRLIREERQSDNRSWDWS